jgi:hypothetical protein
MATALSSGDGSIGRFTLGTSKAAQSIFGGTYTVRAFPKLAHEASIRHASINSSLTGISLHAACAVFVFRLATVGATARNVGRLGGYLLALQRLAGFLQLRLSRLSS